jgi:hypothetical protein
MRKLYKDQTMQRKRIEQTKNKKTEKKYKEMTETENIKNKSGVLLVKCQKEKMMENEFNIREMKKILIKIHSV